MTRALLAIALCVVTASGCLGGGGTGTPMGPMQPGADGSPTAGSSSAVEPTRAAPVSVEYVVRAGNLPDGVAHLYLDFAVYFAERTEDVYACTDDAPLLDNPYDPTATPLRMPAGRCKRFAVPRIDIATLEEPRSLGRFTANATFVGGHTLVIHDVTIVLQNGSEVTDIYDTDFRAVTEKSPPSGSFGIEIGLRNQSGIEAVHGRFGVEGREFEP